MDLPVILTICAEIGEQNIINYYDAAVLASRNRLEPNISKDIFEEKFAPVLNRTRINSYLQNPTDVCCCFFNLKLSSTTLMKTT